MNSFTLADNITKEDHSKLMNEFLQRGMTMFEKVVLTYATLGLGLIFLKFKTNDQDMASLIQPESLDRLLANFVGIMADDLIKMNFL